MRFLIVCCLIFLSFQFNANAELKFNKDNFKDLTYRKIKPNVTTISDQIKISVNKSASPLFYKIDKKLKSIEVDGVVTIKTPIGIKADDVYFSVGVVYEGDYKPNFITRSILPDWLKSVLKINPKKGLGQIHFFEASQAGVTVNKSTSSMGIKMKTQTVTTIKKDNSFSLKVTPNDKGVLGLWFRAEGDNSNAEFDVDLTKLIIN